MLAWLRVPPGAQILDAGCGAGVMLARFVHAVGSGGQVVGLDLNPEVVAQARQNLASLPANRVSFHEGSLLDLPFAPARFDLAWCSFVLHHLPDPAAAIIALRRVVKPGGRIVLREGGVPLHLLPFDLGIGTPGLNDHLRVAHNRWFVDHRYNQPVAQPYPGGWLQALHDAGCTEVTAHSFFLERLPPFSADEREYLVSWLRTPLDDVGRRAYLDADDVRVLEALADPGSPHYALHRADLHALADVSLYFGSV